MTLKLPWPPSLNSYWRRAGHRMHLSHHGRAYRGAVLAACTEQAAPRLGDARIRLTITAHPPDARRRDLDNLTKGVLDSLKYANVYTDDSQVDDLRITRGDTRPGGQLTLHIEAITEGTQA